MIGSSKILTVSYGTFSCTLEGFDDSFETMKAIAEYFRDLAADDRYFGAEPPTPDAEMLARIAQRGIARPVEAHENAGRIVLRAESSEQATSADTGATADTPEQERADRTADAPQPDPQPEQAEATPADSAPVGTQEEPERQDEASRTPAPGVTGAEANAAPSPEAGAGLDRAVQDISETQAPDAREAEATDSESPVTEAPKTDGSADNAVSAVAPAPQSAPDSIAAKLARIRSVVERDEPVASTDYDEDENAPDMLARGGPGAGAAFAGYYFATGMVSDNTTEPSVDTPEDRLDAAPEPSAEDTLAELLADAAPLEAPATEMPDKAPENATEEGTSDEDVTGDEAAEHGATDVATDDRRADGETMAETMADKPDADDLTEDGDGAAADATPDHQAADETVPQPESPDSLEAVTVTTIAPTEDAVSAAEDREDDENLFGKVEGSEADDGAEDTGTASPDTSDDAAEDATGTDTDEDTVGDGGWRLGTEAEAELQRELAEIEAEMPAAESGGTGTGEDDSAAHAQATATSTTEAESDSTVRASADDAVTDATQPPEAGTEAQPQATAKTDVSRIFEETESQLDQPEASRRRNAIQHLRAAVSATRAERSAGASLDRKVDETPYRKDLEQVVRPRRPRPGGALPPGATRSERPERPAAERPAPLKLVAAQRVDTPSSGPVHPRRVSSPEVTPQTEAGSTTSAGFADFAAAKGLDELSDLLEAAAAWLTDIEEMTEFSRPMLMRKLTECEADDFSREDALRAFGQLLRAGKLHKLPGGRFTVTNETDFRDAAVRQVG